MIRTRSSAALLAAAGGTLALASLGACESALDPSGGRPAGLGETRRAGGPRVVWDVKHQPLPEIPLPNDQATRLDPGSPTGRRVNISLDAARTRYERKTRAIFNRLDGFGAYAPITVRFDAPLDLPGVLARHRNDDFRDDAFYLLNVDRSCKRFGEEIALDVGRGRFPIILMSRSERGTDPEAPNGFFLDESDNKMFGFDPEGEALTLLFKDYTEDRNRDGVLQPSEDRNQDGVMDEANFLDPHACDAVPESTPEHDRCVADHLLSWYERASNTLILRPVWPLEERCTHAVVLTKRLRGADGEAVESPFPAVQAPDQIGALEPVGALLGRYGLSKGDVAFAWSYTVGTMTRDLEGLRAGLYGQGPMARLAKEFPVSGFRVRTRNEWREIGSDPPLTAGGDSRVLPGGCAGAAWAALASTIEGDKQICGGYADFASVGGLFAGEFEAPNLLVDQDGHATPAYPADEDEVWDVDVGAGRAVYDRGKVTFFCALPREDARPAGVTCEPGNPEGKPWCKPYPVAFFAHGYGSFKGEFVLHAGRHAQMGFAACGLDSFGHGRSIVLNPRCEGNLDYLAGKGLLAAYGVPELVTMIFYGRDRDLNNDGCPDGGADQWTANLFHTRDVVRQSVFEEMQFVRILHAVDGQQRDASGNVLGDVDGDGEPDIGGRKSITAAWGISLGGQLTGVLAGAEPTLDAVSPNAVGAGLTDVAVRLGEGGLAEAVMLPVQGPIIVGCLPTDGHQVPLTSGEGGASCLPRVDGQQGVAGPQVAGELQLAWYGHDNARLAVRAFAKVPGVAVGDTVRVENVDKGLAAASRLGPRGWARVSIAADALWPIARRGLLGFADDENDARAAPDTTALGDRIRVTVVDGGSGAVKATVDTWQWDVEFQHTIYPAGQPLVAMQEGLGYPRNTVDFRRFYGIAQHAVAPADPAVWSRRYTDDPILAPYDPAWWPGRAHVLVMPTIGDSQVPTATGVALGRTSGLLGSWDRDPARFAPEHGWRELFTPDARYGVSVEQWLTDNWVVEGDWRLQRWASHGVNPSTLFDPDDTSDGAAEFSCLHSYDWSADNGEFHCPAAIDDTATTFDVPRPGPGQAMRQDRPRGDGSYDALRIPLLRPSGQHGIYNPQPFRAFDTDAYMVHFTARFMATRGGDVSHEPGCDCGYAELPRFEVGGAEAWPGVDGVAACPTDDPTYGKRCSAECTAAWGIVPLPPAVCAP
ncbi:MAG: hypothetical protein IT376_12740 [Polyangiaceae bacterium]|nr:hypothetical protein [Polyangiaceae bacterium]